MRLKEKMENLLNLTSVWKPFKIVKERNWMKNVLMSLKHACKLPKIKSKMIDVFIFRPITKIIH